MSSLLYPIIDDESRFGCQVRTDLAVDVFGRVAGILEKLILADSSFCG
jgi:hypothetical protein